MRRKFFDAVTLILKCPVCGKMDERPEQECRGMGLDGPTCKDCYGIPMMLEEVKIKRGLAIRP